MTSFASFDAPEMIVVMTVIGRIVPSSEAKALLEETRAPFEDLSAEPPTVETIVGTSYEWFEAIATRRLAGHTLVSCDDPRRRQLGFVDLETSEMILLPLTSTRKPRQPLAPSLGATFATYGVDDPYESLRTPEGRACLIGTPPLPDDEDDALSKCLLEEANLEVAAYEARHVEFTINPSGNLQVDPSNPETVTGYPGDVVPLERP